MKLLATFVLFVAMAQLAVAADDDAEARKQLAGVWKGRVHEGATGHEITFTADVVSGTKDGERDLGKGSYKVDLTTQPWTMNATEIKADGKKGRDWLGSFKLEGDSLTWCVSTKARPTTFKTGDGQFMLVLKRQKKESSSLVGVWKGRVRDGATGHELTFTKDMVSGTKDGERNLGKGAYKIDRTTQPWTMDATEVKDDGSKGRTWLGSLKLEGDSLTWCVSTQARPTTFKTGDGQFMLVLKRQAGGPSVATPAPSRRPADPRKFRVAKLEESAPAALSSKVRDTLGDSGTRIADSDSKVLCDIWLRKDVPVLSSKQADRKYPLEVGTLVGAIRFSQKGVGDFRDLKVAPGVYTLRYGLQPKDDIHQSTSKFRDFLVLIAAADDTDSARIASNEKLGERGIDTTGGSHPAILFLRPPKANLRELPAIISGAGTDDNTRLGILVCQTTAKGNADIKKIQFEVVTIGYAQE